VIMKNTALFCSFGLIALSICTTPASAQQAGKLDELVVTAQKRAENVQDIPQAVSAITGDELQSRGIVETSDLTGTLPNLQITSAYGKTQPNFSLRGISVANEFSAATASPVGVYVDEVYQSSRASHGQQLYDLERVEVLRGPQGTLYGRNTTGGAINFITRAPTLGDGEAYVTAGYGNYETYTLAGAGELTLVDDKLGVRVAGTLGRGDGFLFNPLQGRDFATTNFTAGRITVRYKPTDTVDITLKAYTGEDDPYANLAYGIGYLENRTNAAGFSQYGPQPSLGGRALQEDEILSDTGGKYFSDTQGLAFTVKAELSDRFTLTSITGFDVTNYEIDPFDCDGSPVDLCAIRYDTKSENFNQDFRLNYDGDGLHFIVGAYYGKEDVQTNNEPDFFGFLRPLLLGAGLPGNYSNISIPVGNSLSTIPAFVLDPSLTPADAGFCDPVVINPDGFFDARSLIAFQADVAATNTAGGTAIQAACAGAGAPPFGPILASQRFDIIRPSYAVYGEAGIDVTDRMSLTLGLRYTRDEVQYRNGSSVVFGLDGVTPIANLVPYSFPFNAGAGAVNQTEKTGRFSGRAIVDYKFTDDILGYASYSLGYRAGTYNALAYQDTSQVYFVEPEKINAYEIGLKSRLLDDRLQLNLAGFYYDYANQQIAQIIGVTSFLRNADGRLFGLEAELRAAVTDSFRIDASFGYLDSEYSGNSIDAADPRSLTISINGNSFANAPEETFALGFDWDIYSHGDSKLTMRADARYQGEYFFDSFGSYGQAPCDQPATGTNVLLASPEIACGNPGYWIFDARMTYDINESISVSAWGKNLADKFYYVYGLNLNAFYQDYFTRGTPRTYGVTATVRF